jgi:HEAT repeat protein
VILKIRYLTFAALSVAAASCWLAFAQAVAAAPDNKDAAQEKQQALIRVLQSDAPPSQKAITCKQLAIYGGKDAVPALAALLPDKDLASWARIALEAIPDPAAGEALREAMGKLKGRLLVGVINSIGVRRDAAAVEALVHVVSASKNKDVDADVASASAVALGRIGGPAAAGALERSLADAPAAVRPAVAQGCILCAQRYLAEGNAAEAVRLYDLVRKADVPKQRILEAVRGAILARKSAGLPLLVEQLRSADKSFLAIGLTTARELPGREATDALVAELRRVSPDRQGLLILALADRGDAAALPAVLQTAKSGPQKAQLVAIRALARLGNVSCVPVLWDLAKETDADVSEAALTVLADLPGKAVDDELAARLPRAEGKDRPILIQLVGRRRIEGAATALLKAADDPDAQVRSAALTALGATIELSDLPLLIRRVADPQKVEEAKAAEAALRVACVRMADREACAAKLAAAVGQAPVAVKCKFLEILGAMGGPAALEALGAAAKAADPQLQDAASRLLGGWMTADAAPVLLDVAKSAADDKYKTRALRGYLRIARQLKLPVAQQLAMCREASALCQRDEEKKLVLEILQRHPSAESLSLAASFLAQADVKQEAGSAAVAIAEKLIRQDPAAVAKAMQQVLAAGDTGATDRAKALLDRARGGSRRK